jgi:hypothetical protein
MKQTAVEWLLNAIETKNGDEFSSYYSEFIEQAKEMEKEQTINFANDFYDDCVMEGGSLQQSAEEYYNDIL